MPDNTSDEAAGGVRSTPAGSERAERRSVPRYRFITRAMVTDLSSGTRLPARTSVLGLNGCYIDTLNLFPVGTLVRLQILKDKAVFETLGRVLYGDPGVGMGIVFLDATPDQRSVLEGWLAEPDARREPAS